MSAPASRALSVCLQACKKVAPLNQLNEIQTLIYYLLSSTHKTLWRQSLFLLQTREIRADGLMRDMQNDTADIFELHSPLGPNYKRSKRRETSTHTRAHTHTHTHTMSKAPCGPAAAATFFVLAEGHCDVTAKVRS